MAPTYPRIRQILSPLGAAAAGGYLVQRLGLPVGWLVGSMAITAAHNLLARTPWHLPRSFRRTGEYLLGVTIGSMFTLAVAQFLAAHLLPVVISVGGAMLAGLFCGYFLIWRMGMNPATALYATTAGGAAEMATLAAQEGGDERFVATYHSVRIGLIVLVVPLTLSLIWPPAAPGGRAAAHWEVAQLGPDLLVCLVGGLGGWLAHRLKFPGGMLTGTILAIGLANILGAGLPTLPREFRYAAQWLIGAGIGCTFDGDAIRQIRALLPIQAVNIALLVTMSVAWAGLLWLFTPLDMLTALLSTAPASAADMTATAIALGADGPVVAAIQALRVIFVSLTMPLLIRRALRRGRGDSPKELTPWK